MVAAADEGPASPCTVASVDSAVVVTVVAGVESARGFPPGVRRPYVFPSICCL